MNNPALKPEYHLSYHACKILMCLNFHTVLKTYTFPPICEVQLKKYKPNSPHFTHKRLIKKTKQLSDCKICNTRLSWTHHDPRNCVGCDINIRSILINIRAVSKAHPAPLDSPCIYVGVCMYIQSRVHMLMRLYGN